MFYFEKYNYFFFRIEYEDSKNSWNNENQIVKYNNNRRLSEILSTASSKITRENDYWEAKYKNQYFLHSQSWLKSNKNNTILNLLMLTPNSKLNERF